MAKSNKHKTKKTQNMQNKKNMAGIVLAALVIIAIGVIFYNLQSCKEEGDEMKKIVVLETNKGDIKIELDLENAPITTENFIKYVEDGHFDGLIFHRVIPNFMIQGGGFKPDGTQKDTREPIVLESDNGLKNDRGTIAMARTMAPNSATSQFFINLNDNDFLNHGARDDGYAVFGKVIEGMSVVDEIAKVQTTTRAGHGDWPVEDIIINKAYLK